MGHAGNKVMISRVTSTVGKARERGTGGRQFKRVQRRSRRLWRGPSGVHGSLVAARGVTSPRQARKQQFGIRAVFFGLQ